MKEIKDLVFKLCSAYGTPGHEDEAIEVARKELEFCDFVEVDAMCGVHAFIGDKNAKMQIMLDAHIDQIGMAVSEIDENGFLKLMGVGGITRATMPGSKVMVYGEKTLIGVVSCLPPHISGEDKKLEKIEDFYVDLGLSHEEVEKIVSLGDRVVLYSEIGELLNDRVCGTALDDRAGCASIIRVAQLLKDEKLNCGVHIVCTTKEETGGTGAQIMTYRVSPTTAIGVDVSFAKQPGVDSSKLGELSKGPMIGFSANLDKNMSSKLIEVAKKHDIPYQVEVMGRNTGTNCDEILLNKDGVPTALVSIPQRNMHSPAEICDLNDIENVAKLIACYILEVQ